MSNSDNRVISKKSELLFLYESTYSIPNGDPFTGEQRYDNESKKVLVSDVRIKRFIRNYLHEKDQEIYVLLDKSEASKDGKESGSAARIKSLKKKYPELKKSADVLKKCIDVRLFGGISTEEGDAANITGPIQFALLNPSLNTTELRPHQNTCVFPSAIKNEQGTIGTTTVVPYSINQIHGWTNPYSAKHTDLSDEDVNIMFKALWESINSANTRTKSNQNSPLLIQVIYADPTSKIYGMDRKITHTPLNDKTDEQLRSIADYTFNFAEFEKIIEDQKVEKVRWYSDIDVISSSITSITKGKNKLEKMDFSKIVFKSVP
ncbi:MAG: type I-B CRISPR-associated protein Cas7/Csh2 [Candidatus Wallbacteria bacterium]|nr:type I-B CRISPR-associated protein Cas7/Csh2 [Candidatus Wallbacteria bacterium]